MKLLFTRSPTLLSWIIRHGLQEPVSHFAIEFDNHLVFHSDLLGVHLQWGKSFRRKCQVVYEIDFMLAEEGENQLYLSIVDKFDGRPYDYGGLLYFMWRAFLRRFFNRPLPTKNAWARGDAYLCSELFLAIPETKNRPPRDYSLVSPYEIYMDLRGTKEIRHRISMVWRVV